MRLAGASVPTPASRDEADRTVGTAIHLSPSAGRMPAAGGGRKGATSPKTSRGRLSSTAGARPQVRSRSPALPHLSAGTAARRRSRPLFHPSAEAAARRLSSPPQRLSGADGSGQAVPPAPSSAPTTKRGPRLAPPPKSQGDGGGGAKTPGPRPGLSCGGWEGGPPRGILLRTDHEFASWPPERTQPSGSVHDFP